MPKKKPENAPISLHALDMILVWGKTISAQRKLRNITMRDFAYRVSVSLNTLQRMERGEHSVQVGNYLNAMAVLGILDKLCNMPSNAMMESRIERVRSRISKDDPDYF